MRLVVVLIGLLSVGATGCGKSKASAAEPPKAEEKAAEPVGVSANARIGGNVADVGDHKVEVLLHRHGRVEALVAGPDGKLIEGADAAKLEATVPVEGGAKEHVALKWDKARGRYIGHAKGGAKLAPGEVELKLETGGKTATGKLADAAVLVGPEFGGTLLAAGKYGTEVRVGADGDVEAHVRNAAGVELKGDAGLDVKANLHAEGGKTVVVALAWDPVRAAFVGKAQAGLALLPGPIELTVDGKADGKATGRLEAVALAGVAAHGGRIVVVGDYSLELVAEGGALYAYAMDLRGKAYAKGDLDLKLNIEGRPIVLVWSAANLRFEGKLAAKIDLDVAPIDVNLSANGRAFVGGRMRADAALAADARANANLNAKLDAKADAKALAGARVEVRAPKVEITPPKVDLKVEKSASFSAGAGGGAKAGAGANANVNKSASTSGKTGFSIGTK